MSTPIATWPRLLGVVAMTVVLAVAGSTVAVMVAGAAPGTHAFPIALFTGAAAGELIAVGLLTWALRRRGMAARDVGFGRPTTATALLLGVGLGLVYGAVTIAALPEVADYLWGPIGLKLISIATTVVIVGVAEEVIFRGYVMNALASMGHGRAIQVLVSALAFGLAHFSNPGAMAFTFVLGLGLGAVYLVGKRSLTPVIVAHMLVNLIIEPGLYMSIV